MLIAGWVRCTWFGRLWRIARCRCIGAVLLIPPPTMLGMGSDKSLASIYNATESLVCAGVDPVAVVDILSEVSSRFLTAASKRYSRARWNA